MRHPNIHRLGMHKQRVCPHICIRGGPAQTSAAADRNKGQFADHAATKGQDPNNEPVTLSQVYATAARETIGGHTSTEKVGFNV
ncbi:MAG: hypothetical protein GX456_03540 [Verrucomicrobia bacterium]|nr:hypothetical protein [Verrucomicrobiota bacterium]